MAARKSAELHYELENSMVTVTHDMQQAARVSDYTPFVSMAQRVEAYITGRFR